MNKGLKTWSFFDEIRSGEVTHYDTVSRLKKRSNNYDNELLKHLLIDLDDYLSYEKNELESEITGEEIQKRINDFNERGIEIPYYEEVNLKSLNDETVPKTITKLDLEKLMYGMEFYLIYQFRNMVNDIVNENKINTLILPVNWKGSTTELVELIKALVESNVLDSSLSEKEIVDRFSLFFNYGLTGYSQNKTKVRNRLNDKTIFINKLNVNLESWIKKNYD